MTGWPPRSQWVGIGIAGRDFAVGEPEVTVTQSALAVGHGGLGRGGGAGVELWDGSPRWVGFEGRWCLRFGWCGARAGVVGLT